MTTEFNLSEKIDDYGSIHSVNVKEFIRLLDQWKEIMRTWHIELPTIHLLCSEFDNFKNKLAGNKLNGKN